MSAHIPINPDDSHAWGEVEEALGRLAAMAHEGAALDAFHGALLEDLVRLLAANGGAVWVFGESGELCIEQQINAQKVLGAPDSDRWHSDLLVASLHGRAPLTAPPLTSRDGSPANPTGYQLTLMPMMVDDVPAGVIEVFHDRVLALPAQRGVERLLTAVAEMASDFHRARQLARLRDAERQAAAINRFAVNVHRSLEPRATAYAIANETRLLLQCDRVSVLTNTSSRIETLAVSGVESVDRRAESIATLESLAEAVAHTGTAIWHDPSSTASPEYTALLERYVDVAHASTVALLPLTLAVAEGDESLGAEVVGVLVLENMEAPWPSGIQGRAHLVAQHSASALSNADDYGTLPLLFLSTTLRKARWLFSPSGRPTVIAGISALIVIALALWLIPANLTITARGHVTPAVRARIFAPYDADVISIKAADGRPVRAGQVLLTLQSLELEAERQQVVAKLETARARLKVIDIQMVTERERDSDSIRQAQLSADRQQVELLQQIHEQRLALVDEKLQRLVVSSPIDGVVLSWMLEDLLSRRHVTRGQHLLTVGDINGAWIVELDVSDYDIYHLNRVLARDQQPEVRFMLESLPGKSMRGRVRSVASAATVAENGRRIVPVVVDVVEFDQASETDAKRELRPGAAAVARIRCGKASLGYSWFHDLLDVVRTWTWL